MNIFMPEVVSNNLAWTMKHFVKIKRAKSLMLQQSKEKVKINVSFFHRIPKAYGE